MARLDACRPHASFPPDLSPGPLTQVVHCGPFAFTGFRAGPSSLFHLAAAGVASPRGSVATPTNIPKLSRVRRTVKTMTFMAVSFHRSAR